MTSHVLSLDAPMEPELTSPDPGVILQGAPKQRIWNYFSDAGGHFHTGRWASSKGLWRVRYTEIEVCYLLSGAVRLTADGESGSLYRAGAAFVVLPGFSGTWEVLEDCEKLYCIFEPPSGDGG